MAISTTLATVLIIAWPNSDRQVSTVIAVDGGTTPIQTTVLSTEISKGGISFLGVKI